MAQIKCNAITCTENKDNICVANNIDVSVTGVCLTNTIRKDIEGLCLTCSHCSFYKVGQKLMKPICEVGNQLNFNSNNECWQDKDS